MKNNVPEINLKIKPKVRKKRVGYTKAQYEQMMNIVERYDFLNVSNDAILTELIRCFPKIPPTYDVLTTLRKKIKARNKADYDTLKTKNDEFIGQIIQKRRNLDFVKYELLSIYNKPQQSDVLKMKILDKLVQLDMIDLQFIQDFPYLNKYHEDLEREFKELDEDIKQLGEKIDEDKKPAKPINPIFKTSDPNRIPIESITKNKEIQEILMSRTQSGFEGRLSKD